MKILISEEKEESWDDVKIDKKNQSEEEKKKKQEEGYRTEFDEKKNLENVHLEENIDKKTKNVNIDIEDNKKNLEQGNFDLEDINKKRLDKQSQEENEEDENFTTGEYQEEEKEKRKVDQYSEFAPPSEEDENNSNSEEDFFSNEIFDPSLRGMDAGLEIQQMYQNKEISIEQVFKKVTSKIIDKSKGLASFYFINEKEKNLEKLYNFNDYVNYEKFINEVTPESDAFYNDQKDFLLSLERPWISDTTFQEEKPVFVFPFFDGPTFLGVCTVHFQEKVDENVLAYTELLIETTRGIYLRKMVENGIKGSASEEMLEEDKGILQIIIDLGKELVNKIRE